MGERLRFYTDEQVSKAVIKGLERRGVDVLTTVSADMLGSDDRAQLAFATREGRVLYTQDDDFLRLHASGTQHAGIVYAAQGKSVGEVLRGLMLIYDVLDANEMKNHVEFL